MPTKRYILIGSISGKQKWTVGKFEVKLCLTKSRINTEREEHLLRASEGADFCRKMGVLRILNFVKAQKFSWLAGPPNNCTFQQSVVALIGLNSMVRLVPMSMALAIAAQNSQKAKVVSIIVAPSPFELFSCVRVELLDLFNEIFRVSGTKIYEF